MPCVLKVKIVAARDLPVMDRTSESTDAYCEIRFANLGIQRTQVARKTLNPFWNEDFRLEVSDDSDLQNEPLEIRIFDYDTITSNDIVGSVFLDLNPLLTWESPGQISGWFPVYDTLRGICGEVNAQVKLQFFGDVNPFKESSAGVQFFSMTRQPADYQIAGMYGFVDALVIDDDPEYHWSDSFRTQRTSNEARQRLLFRLSGQLRRLMGQKVLQLGGNAVLGYKQSFDLENEERSITARAIGTAVKLSAIEVSVSSPLDKVFNNSSINVEDSKAEDTAVFAVVTPLEAPSPTRESMADPTLPSPQHRQNSIDSTVASNASLYMRGKGHSKDYSLLEQEIFTLHDFPPSSILHLGGIVTARSVKLIENDAEEVRDAWWTELRDEIKSHARALGCPHVLGYTETSTINDELCVLSATGTAAILDLAVFTPHLSAVLDEFNPSQQLVQRENLQASLLADSIDGDVPTQLPKPSYTSSVLSILAKRRRSKKHPPHCRMCHTPYSRKASPFQMSFVKCGCCKKKYVPEILLATIEPPQELDVIGIPCFVEAHICRYKKRKEGESNAAIVSDAVPFVEYDIHRQLMYKLKIQGMNAIFGLRFHLTVGESLIVAVACGTALYLSALPTPAALRIARNLEAEDKQLLEIQRKIMELSEANRKKLDDAYRARRDLEDSSEDDGDEGGRGEENNNAAAAAAATATGGADYSDSSEESDGSDDRERYQHNAIVQIDDDTDEDFMAVLLDPNFTGGFTLTNTETLPNHPFLSFQASAPFPTLPSETSSIPIEINSGSPTVIHLITTVKQGSISMISHNPNLQLATIFRGLYEELRFRLSYFEDCVLAGIMYDIRLVKDYELHVRLSAVAIGRGMLGDLGLMSLRSIPFGQDESEEAEETGEIPQKNDNVLKQNGDETATSLPLSLRITTEREGEGLSSLKESDAEDEHMVFEMEDDRTGDSNPPSPMSRSGNSVQASLKSDSTPAFQAPQSTALPLPPPPPPPPPASSGRSTRRQSSISSLTNILHTRGGLLATSTSSSTPLSSTAATQPLMIQQLPAPFIEMTPLSYVPGAATTRYLGKLSLHFVKESHIAHHEVPTAGMGAFLHLFLTEVQAILRANVAALGGNAILGYRIDQSFFQENLKNQGYALVSLSGDVCEIKYPDEPGRVELNWVERLTGETKIQH